MATDNLDYSPLYQILVRVSETYPRMERKLQKYFQNPWRSGGGKCKVKFGPQEGTFWVEFYKKQAMEGVIAKREHSVPVTDTDYVDVFIEASEDPGENNTVEISQPSSQTQEVPKESPNEKKPDEGGATGSDSFSQNVFVCVEAQLNVRLSKEQKEKILNCCPSVRLEGGQEGPEKVVGHYADVEKVHRFLSDGILVKEDLPHLASARTIEQILPKESDNPVPESNPEDRPEESDPITVPSHLYDYFKCFSSEILDKIEKEHRVRITSTVSQPVGNVCLNFETSNSRDRKAAREAFTKVFRKEIQNVTHQDVHFKDDKLAHDVHKKLTDMFKNLRVEAEGKVLSLSGNPQVVIAAQHFIDANFPRRQPQEMMASQNVMKNGIEVDTAPFRFLSQEFRGIEAKYNTVMEVKKNPLTQKTLIVFKPKNKGLDRSAEAYEYFIRSFQMLLPQIVKEVLTVKPYIQESMEWPDTAFNDEFEFRHPYVTLECTEQDLILTGLQRYLAEALQYAKKYFGVDGTEHRYVRPPLTRSNWNREFRTSLHEVGTRLSIGLPRYRLAKWGKVEAEECVICMGNIRHKEILPKCKHMFCGPCIKQAMKHKPVCPVCNTSYGSLQGNQPEGTMTTSYRTSSLPGFNSCGTIVIHYHMRGGIQTADHPNPGRRYDGTRRVAYLPNNDDGRKVLLLLRKAFEQKLIFTVGQSQTSGVKDVIIWNDIHHKTLQFGGPENFGYPDPDYLQRVIQELKAKGIE